MRRHRVRLRSKARRRRGAGTLAALAAAAACGLWAWPPARQRVESLRLPPLAGLLPAAARVDSVEVSGAPEALKEAVVAATGWSPGARWSPSEASRIERELPRRLGCLKSVSVRRSWGRRSALISVTLRAPVARASREGWSGYLDAEGALFSAPAAIFDAEGMTEIELGDYGGEGSAELARLARSRRFALLRFEGEEGWSGRTAGGERVWWGALESTELKLSRLAEVLRDAGGRFGGAAVADLRHFSDGKIFVRPRL